MNGIGVIRQRGQFTISDDARAMYEWLREGSAVEYDVSEEEMVIKPAVSKNKKQFDWDLFERKVALARSFGGEKGNLSAMVAQDRKSH